MDRATKFSVLYFAIALLSRTIAWEGMDAVSGDAITIASGNLVREGETIEVHNHTTGENKSMYVSDVQRFGGNVEIQGTDSETGEERMLEMDR